MSTVNSECVRCSQLSGIAAVWCFDRDAAMVESIRSNDWNTDTIYGPQRTQGPRTVCKLTRVGSGKFSLKMCSKSGKLMLK